MTYHNSTAFTDTRWRFVRVKLRTLPTEVAFLAGERMADRIIEKDPESLLHIQDQDQKLL